MAYGLCREFWLPQIRGTILGPHSKDCNILESTLGSPYFLKIQCFHAHAVAGYREFLMFPMHIEALARLVVS